MNYFLTVLLLFCIFQGIFIFILQKKYRNIKSDIGKILLAIKRVRYGDINIRLEELNDSEIKKTINRLFETIYDREMMIKEYQNALSKKNLSLEEVIKQEKQLKNFKEEFAATLTHDMKVPVIAELNSINYLLEGRFGELNSKQTEVLKLMLSSNRELKDLIENILEIYKLEQQELKLDITKNNFNEFLNEIIKEMEPIALKTGHEISCKIDETSNLIIEFDKFQMKRVIKNLIQNAISFSPCESEVKIQTLISMNFVKFIISNSGKGISKDDLELIFQKYYTLNSKYKKSGTGLGLYLSKQIILAHNGSIEIDNSQDNLTAFILTLPL